MTKNFSYIQFFIFMLISCSNIDNGKHPKSDSLTKTVPGDINNPSQFQDSFFFVSSGQMSPFKTITIDKIHFQLVKDSQGDTSFMGTWDESFVTPEGYKVGMSLQQIQKKYKDKLGKELGWGYYIELPSKWNLQFVVGRTTTDHAPLDTNKVTYIFKRY